MGKATDLKNIWNYTLENWSENQADKYLKELFSSFDQIGLRRIIGKEYHGIVEELRGIKINKHIVFYREIKEDKTEITRILHERTDLIKRLGEK